MQSLVTVVAFPSSAEGEIARNRLAEVGILAYLADAEEVCLQVAEADVQVAREVLARPSYRHSDPEIDLTAN